MNKKAEMSDVIVVGAGMAGLTAALTVAQAGKRVTLLAAGAGALSIGSGCIDLLGYVDGEAVQGDPLDAIAGLPPEHPYQVIGREAVQGAFHFFSQLCRARQWPLLPSIHKNRWLPTIMGTLKPSYLCPPSADGEALGQATRIGVVGIDGLKDCQPELICQQLRSYPHLQDKEYQCHTLPSPLGKTHRNINPLDLARHVDSPQGLAWLVDSLKALRCTAEVLLLPPLCGTQAHSKVWAALQESLGCKIVEMLSIPPGVGGLRLRALLMQALRDYPVNMVENTRVHSAQVADGHCRALRARSSFGEREYAAKAFIIATGGFLGEGLIATVGHAHEAIFGLPIDTPPQVEDWSAPDIFGQHNFARMGVRVNQRLAPLALNVAGDTTQELYANVHFAGRILAGYDFAAEKSGNGVALVSAWHAAQQVLRHV